MEERTVHFRPPLWLPVAIAVILGFSFVAGKKIETRGAPATISVTGEGKITATPDISSLRFGVQTGRVKTAQEATTILQEKMEAILSALDRLEIEKKDINTQSLNLYPAYDWEEGTRIDRGFEASQNLTVKVRDLDKVGAVLSAVTGAGANQVGGVSFTIDDPDELQAQARKLAIEDAQEKAEKLASDLGVHLKKLKGYNEGGSYQPPEYMERAMMMDAGMGGAISEPLPVPAGEQEIRAMVTLTYEVR